MSDYGHDDALRAVYFAVAHARNIADDPKRASEIIGEMLIERDGLADYIARLEAMPADPMAEAYPERIAVQTEVASAEPSSKYDQLLAAAEKVDQLFSPDTDYVAIQRLRTVIAEAKGETP